MDAKAPEGLDTAEKLDKAHRELRELGFDDDALRRAASALKPHISHKKQIRKIVARLGLDPEGDIAIQWTLLCDSFGKAHQRSFTVRCKSMMNSGLNMSSLSIR
jgi:hypothetical protein